QQFVQEFLRDGHSYFLSVKYGPDQLYTEDRTLSSIVSLWEIAIKIRIGKLDADMNDILAAIPEEGFSLLQIQPEHLHILMSLPLHHRDPFDHLLMAQAQVEHATFLSEDGQMDHYPIKRIRCS
ncbi:type II toxin-antitoxin system VapC family toxin, partial [Komagataeibacter xylinus]|uniref:type II toxin-antitoxin system VapC family toxin n=3 Tax=Komagataeibacter xylinus TaxID=28448 RepID=UPI0021ACBD06